MRMRSHFALGACVISALLVAGSAAQAMDIKEYYGMADEDQARFSQMLLDGAEKLLRDEGRSDVALKLDKLFTDVKPGNKIADGTYEFLHNLEDMLRAEVKREAANPNLPHLRAERAFRDVAGDHGITLPPNFDVFAASFRPQSPPRDLSR